MAITVKPYCRLVPNGLATHAEAGKLIYKFVLIASPVRDDSAGSFDIRQWPEQMFVLMTKEDGFEVEYTTKGGKDKKSAIASRMSKAAQHWKTATQAWKELAEGVTDKDWVNLLTTIEVSLQSKSLAADFSNKVPEFAEADLDRNGDFHDAEPENDTQLTINAVLPVRQGDLAYAFEVERAKQLLTELAPDPQITVKKKDAALPTAVFNLEETDQKKGEAEFAAEEKKKKLTKLNKLLDATKDFRKVSNDLYCKPVDRPTESADIETVKKQAAATHQLSVWPQKTNLKQAETQSAIVSAYYAIHSSPVWARLFAFAIDLELETTELISAVACGGDSQCQFKNVTLPKVISSVAEATGWPNTGASDGAGGELAQICEAVPKDCFQRFDLVTLDLRAIADGFTVSDDKDEDKDKETGEAGRSPRYATAGLALLDRNKPFNAAKKLEKTTDVGGRNCTDITLYAEDWTIGQKLDIGILDKNSILHWRSMMGRVGRYSFRVSGELRGIDEKSVLAPLLGTGLERATLEETLLGSVSRLIPRPKAAKTQREAIVEEMVASWSGTPFAVYAGPDVDYALSQDLENDEGEIQPTPDTALSFYQTYDLPGKAHDATLRLPPLRYGRSYTAGLRPVFMGGGSASAAAATISCYSKPGYALLGENKLRRFVRHEAINPPYVLLPVSELTDATFPELDYARADSVVLRSRVDGNVDKNLAAPIKPDINGRRYYSVDERLGRRTAVRILVPPQVTHEELLRAGVFDSARRDKKALARLQGGGLLKIAFGAMDKNAKTPEEKTTSAFKKNPSIVAAQGGFPSAVVDAELAFGAEGTAFGRRVNWHQDFDSSENGEAPRGNSVFVLDQVMKPYYRFPYYPDPHAADLYIRLRHRFSKVYLEGHKIVPVYNPEKGHVYPDALPTAFTFNKTERVGGVVAKHIDDVTKDFTYTRFDGTKFGNKGQHVHLVEFNLSPADDYEIEAFYVPTRDRLATHFAVTEMAAALQAASAKPSLKDTVAQHVTTGGLSVPPEPELLEFSDSILTHCAVAGPLAAISSALDMRAAHAVNRPRMNPAFAPKGKEFAVDIPRVDPATSTVSEGSKDYLLNGSLVFDAPSTSAIEIIAACASPRNPLFDDPDRGRSLKARIAGKWKSYQSIEKGERKKRLATVCDVYGFDVEPRTGKANLNRLNTVRLLRVESIAVNEGELSQDGSFSLDLTTAHQSAFNKERALPPGVKFSAAQTHGFPDGKARLLSLQAIAVTRFAPDFETAARWAKEDLPTVRLRQPLQSPDTHRVTAGEPVEVWLKSSQRPAKCDLLTPVPTFSFSRKVVTDLDYEARPASIRTTRVSSIRVYMNRGWYSSGEGERLGLIIWPPNHFDSALPRPGQDDVIELEHSSGSHEKRRITLTGFKDEQVGPGGAFITRWGGDPTKHDYAPQDQYLMPVSAFVDLMDAKAKQSDNPHAPKVAYDVDVPIRSKGTEDTGDNTRFDRLRCTLLTYEPCFDMDREQWYVNIRITSEATPNQFVRLGLVRFQPHSITDDLRCSEPVTVWSQLMPERVAECSVTDSQYRGADGRQDVRSAPRIDLLIKGLAHARVHEPDPAVDPDVYTTQAAMLKRREEMQDALATLHRPYMTVGVFHETKRGDVVRRNKVRVLDGNALQEIFPPPNSEGATVWKYCATLDPDHLDSLGEGQVYLFAEERERGLPASYDMEPVKPDDMFRKDRLAKSGAKFEVRLDLDFQGVDGK